jgi:hypothetical protein
MRQPACSRENMRSLKTSKHFGKIVLTCGLVLIVGGTLFPFNFSFDEHRSLRNSFRLASAIADRGNDLLIGVDGALRQPFTGRIDNIRIYRRALSAAEVAEDARIDSNGAAADPVAAYPFDEGSGVVTEDESSNRNDGGLVNGPKWSNDRTRGFLRFTGAGEYVRVPNSPSLDISGTNITISMWIAVDKPADRVDQAIIAKPWRSNLMEDPYYQYAVEFDANGRKSVDFYFGDTSGRLRGPFSIMPPTGVWTHVAFTYDGNLVRGYVDGREQLSTGITDRWRPGDLAINLLLFMPFGFGIGILGRQKGFSTPTILVSVFVAASMFSLGIEVLQSWLPGRYSSFVDVASNGVGAAVGSACYCLGRYRKWRYQGKPHR